jgi:hypothetical protein
MKIIILAIFTIITLSLMNNMAFANVKWNLGGGVATGYDDNITNVNTNQISDMITRTSLGGGLTQEGRNDQFDLKGVLTENIYTNHSSFDNLEENLSADYKGDLNAYEHLKAKDIFTHTDGPSSLENAFGRINGHYGTYYNNLDLESATDITEQWSTTFKYLQTNYLFSSSSLSNSAGYNPEISAKYEFSSKAQVTANYDYRLRTFSPGGSADANTPSVGWRQYLNPLWYTDFLLGVDFINGFGQSLTKPRYAVGLTHDVDQTTNLKLTFNKQYETDPFTQDISNNWHVVLNGNHQFNHRFSGDIAFFLGQGKYVISGISYKFIGTDLTLKYAMNNHLDFVLTYELENSVSNSSIRASTHNTVFAGLTFKS